MESFNTQPEQPIQKSNNSLIYSLIAIIVILLVYIGYVYSTKVIVTSQKMQEEYTKKTDTTFDMLPQEIQNKYVLKSLYDFKINQLEAKNRNTIRNLEETLAKKESKTEEKSIENENIADTNIQTNSPLLPKEQTIEKQIVSNDILKMHTSKTYTCKTLRNSSEYITQKCKKELIEFLDKNKDAKRFEVIGVIDNQEFKLLKKLEDVYGKKRLGNLSKYAQSGLSRQRVIEASWVVKQHLGKKVVVDAVNYTITKKHKRGFVVKAYR